MVSRKAGEFGSLAGAQFLSGPVYCLHEKHFPHKMWKPGVLEALHSLGETTVLSSRCNGVLGGGQGIII